MRRAVPSAKRGSMGGGGEAGAALSPAQLALAIGRGELRRPQRVPCFRLWLPPWLPKGAAASRVVPAETPAAPGVACGGTHKE